MGRPSLARLHSIRRSLRFINLELRRLGRSLVLVALFLTAVVLPVAIAQTASHASSQPASIDSPSAANEAVEQQARQQYEAGNFADASVLWQQLAEHFQAAGDTSGEVMALSNLSLTYQQLGQWEGATAAIAASLAKIQTSKLDTQNSNALLAQALDVQGRLQFSQGQADAALETWQQAAKIYSQMRDSVKLIQNRINQAQALQTSGNFRQAEQLLQDVNQTLQATPDSLVKATGLRSLGNLLRATGDLESSRQVLQQSLAVAQKLSNPQATAEALLSLGNAARASGNFQKAIEQNSAEAKEKAEQDFQAARDAYQQAATIAPSPLTRIQAQLNQFSLLVEQEQWQAAIALQPQIQAQLDRLPPNRATVYATVNYVKYLPKLSTQTTQRSSWQLEAAQRLAKAVQQAKQLKDPQAEAYALGVLGTVYEQNQQVAEALQLTRQALQISQTSNASDSRYRWQWQLGRLLWAKGDIEGAITAYSDAVKTLQSIRSELVAMNPEIQFSFRDDVEPVYRQFVALLLQSENPSQANLHQARETIELLQLAELDNFLRQACLQPRKQIDTIAQQEAVFYPIILKQRIEVVLKLPGQAELRHYATPIAQETVEKTLETLRQDLRKRRPIQNIQALSGQVYDWLIRPVEAELANRQVQTLVFVLDGSLRSIPMAVLYDGQQYLIEKYSVALTPGLELTNPKPLKQVPLKALVAGVSEQRPPDFSALPNVETELKDIQATVPSQVLLNQQFTTQQIQTQINLQSFSIVHFATHGEFGSTADRTFILAWDKPLNVNQLSTLLQTKDTFSEAAIELLVLSACQTAIGDKRAVLGIAGVAVRAGARSTVASLWNVNDASTALLMKSFYGAIAARKTTKAEALRQAQLILLKHPNSNYAHPIVWAPYVLVGNWQ